MTAAHIVDPGGLLVKHSRRHRACLLRPRNLSRPTKPIAVPVVVQVGDLPRGQFHRGMTGLGAVEAVGPRSGDVAEEGAGGKVTVAQQ